jgi:hypothetical protein
MAACTASGVGSEAWDRERILVSEDKKQQTLPEFAQAIYKKGFEEAEKGNYDEAIGILNNINAALPVMTAAQLQAGRCHWEMHRWSLARQHFETAVRLEPNNDDAGWTVGLLALQMGDFKAGWEGYERRWGSKAFKSPKLHTKHPQWERGKGLKRPVVWCEQGIGDQILYASLLEALAREVDEVTVMIDLRMVNLFQRGCRAKNVKFLSHNSRIKMSEHDSHLPIASLARHFVKSIRDITPHVSFGYVKADPERVALLRKEYGFREDEFVVGLCWTSTAPIIGTHKSVPLKDFLPILDMPHVKFINLQYGEAQKEGEGFHPSLTTTHVDTFLDMENVAALMEICTVIISPSCATVHLAGAMGKDVLLLDANKLWYWNNRVGNESLWYSGVKIFQRENMNAPWDMQLRQVKNELEIILGQRTRNKQTFVFFHVGQDISYPQKMVKSILRYNPDADIIMCTDTDTPDVMGITDRYEMHVDRAELLYARNTAYANLKLDCPALYLDTDMLIQSEIDVEDILNGTEVAFCKRSFNREDMFNIEQRGIKFPEYEGKSIGEVYPYVGCMIATRNNKVWEELLAIFDSLDPKFKKWYGDQEALRIYAEKYGCAEAPESIYGCLPEHRSDEAKILHFKGPSRKKLFEGV